MKRKVADTAKGELHADMDGYVLCPRRGEISGEWCEGCPDLVNIERSGGRVVVMCDAEKTVGHYDRSSPLRDDLWG